MTLARRFAPLLMLLLLVTGLFVFRSAGAERQLDECLDPEGLRRMDLVSGTRKATELLGRHTDLRIQWTAGSAGSGTSTDPKLRVRILRDLELFALWLHPTLALDENYIPDEERLEWVETSAGLLPVHLGFKYSSSRPRLVAYTYIYGQQAVANPLSAALKDSFRAVVGGTRPLTLMLVSGTTYHGQIPSLYAASTRWLVSAFERYREICGP